MEAGCAKHFSHSKPIVQPNRKVLTCSTWVQQHVDVDSFLVSRAHVHSDPICNRRDSSKTFAPRYVFTSCSSKSEEQFTTGREAQIFQFNLGTNYSRPLSLASNQGLPDRVCKNPNSEKFTECTSPVSGQEINFRQGSIRITGEACNSLGESTSSRGRFVSSLFVVPKKGGGNSLVVNLKPLNQFLV